MRYLIDGHNLIPKLGLKLDSLDDEIALVERIQAFCRLRRAQAEIYFDGATPGQPAKRQIGAVTAHFIRRGSSADAAIESRLERLGRQARNWTVVSSDNRVSTAARSAHAISVAAEVFANQMAAAHQEGYRHAKQETGLSPQEVEEWLTMFRTRPPRP